MKTAYSFLGILTSICENKSSRTEVNQLIELSQSYAYTHLKYRFKNLSKVLMAEDLTLQELAIDAIALLFERNESGIFKKITKAFNYWEPKIDSEEKALFFLNRIVSKSVEKYASELLRQSDPFFQRYWIRLITLLKNRTTKRNKYLVQLTLLKMRK